MIEMWLKRKGTHTYIYKIKLEKEMELLKNWLRKPKDKKGLLIMEGHAATKTIFFFPKP